MTQAIPSRGQNGKFIKTLKSAEKDAEAARLRSLGLSFAQIAQQLGYADESGAYKAYQRALKAVPVEHVTELRGTALARLDMATRKVVEVIARRHLHVASSGKVATDPLTGEVLIDDTVLLQAVDRLVKLEERRSRLLGLDAPARVDMAVSDETDRKIEELMAEIRGEPKVTRELPPGEVMPTVEEA